MQRRRTRPNNAVSADLQRIYGLLRMMLAFFSLLGLAWFGGVVFEGLVPAEVVRQFLDARPTFKIFPFHDFFFVALHPASWRYFIAPLTAIFAIFLGAAFFVRDIYALPRLREAVRYILSSMTGLVFPRLNIDAGEQQVIRGRTNLADAIGGPALVTIQPGNVVMFHHLRQPSNISLGETYFLEPFERIGQIADLDDQQDDRTNVSALTRDGIRIAVMDIHFRYRIFPELQHGQPVRRSLNDPYPFDERALWNMAYNLSVEERGLETWRAAVGRVITGGITDFINFHDVDYLTAPRENQQDPRREIRHSLFFGGTRIGMRRLGAELLWVDIGHFSIVDNTVDEVRQGYWAAQWNGRADVTRALGESKRSVYREQGRAEAQVALIEEIFDGLKLPSENTEDNRTAMRRLFLLRMANILEAMDVARARLDAGDR